MGELTVFRPGLQAQIQDQGRTGLAYYAIPTSGPLDGYSADLANVLLGNDAKAALIECHFVAPTLRFDSDATICLTGASLKWTLDGRRLKRNRTYQVSVGSQLSGQAAKRGCRAYIGIRGEMKTERTFGSAACYAAAGFGGNEGRILAVGDKIFWKETAPWNAYMALDISGKKWNRSSVRILPGPEFLWLTAECQRALTNTEFCITSDSNRMGAKLTGPRLSVGEKCLSHSMPVLPGMIQLPPSGHPIVVLQDGQTTGGYPRIGYIPQAELCRLNQVRPGDSFRFEMAE
ncbi:MAG: biotin-dependent carboxyltransferase family protein [Fuerstiella sp.]